MPSVLNAILTIPLPHFINEAMERRRNMAKANSWSARSDDLFLVWPLNITF